MKFSFLTFFAFALVGSDLNKSNRTIAEYGVGFRINNAGLEVTGHFEDIDVRMHFDENDLRNSSINANAKVASIKTGILLRDKHLQKGDYFHAALYPEIRLSSKSFKKIGRKKFTGTFILEIKHLSQEVVIPFTIENNGTTRTFSGKFEINRLEFGLGEESVILDDTVTVEVMARTQGKF